jgi:phosphatidylethanolamine-binding protein (PEBP) family uncharacterized protein
MEIYYNNIKVKKDDFLKPSETQVKPEIKLNLNSDKYYTLIMYDPDSVGGTFVHWLVTNIKDNNINSGKTLIPYKGPAPPQNTGKHRYIFELYEQNKLINIELERISISINEIRKLLGLTNYIYKIKFISKNDFGGKRNKKITKRKSRKIKNKRKTYKRKY